MGRPVGRAVATALVAGILATGLSVAAGHAPPIATAERALGGGEAPPAPDASVWVPVRLPDTWDLATRRRHRAAWYRAVVPLAADPREPWAVYLPRVVQNATVLVNGVVVGDGGRTTPPLPRNWNRPLLFTVPAPLLHRGDNVVAIRVLTEPGAPGHLRPFHVAPLEELRPRHVRRSWWQEHVVQIVAGSTLAGGLLLFGLAWKSPAFAPLRWVGLALVCWAWSIADAFVQEIPVPTRVWEWSTASALAGCPVLFVLGVHRLLGLDRPGLERAFVSVALAATAALALVPALWAFAAMLASVGVAVAMSTYLLGLGMRSAATGRTRGTLLAPGIAVVVVGLHDLIAVAAGGSPLGVLLSPYLPIVAVTIVAWRLLASHIASVEQTAALARTLERRVQEKHAELERNHARVLALDRDRAVAAERARIMQDVHDGVGGQLVSALALIERPLAEVDAVATLLRGALEDLRLIIDSLDPTVDGLADALGNLRARLEPLLRRRGLVIRWSVRDVPPVSRFGPELALHSMRVVQEAVANVLKHADARTVTVGTGDGVAPDGRPGAYIEIRDDGRGFSPEATRGRGLTGMARRADRLGGRLEIASSPAGTTVRLWLPLEPRTA